MKKEKGKQAQSPFHKPNVRKFPFNIGVVKVFSKDIKKLLLERVHVPICSKRDIIDIKYSPLKVFTTLASHFSDLHLTLPKRLYRDYY